MMQYNVNKQMVKPPVEFRAKARGFSLVELILALGLGVLVTAGIVQLFVGNNQTYTLLNGQSRLQESARYALDFIGRSARTAGYFGCDPEDDRIYNTLNGAWNQLFEFDISTPVQAFNYTGNGTATGINDWTPPLTNLPRQTGGGSINTFNNGTGIDLTEVIPNTDILVFRRVEIPGNRIAQLIQPGDDPVVLDDPNVTFQVNDFAVINNCEQAALFRVTGVVSAGGETTLTRGTGTGVFENALGAGLSEEGIPYGTAVNGQGSSVGRIITEIYFIANGAGINNRGDTPRALWRRSGVNAPVELIEGVRDLQVLFGVDTTPNDNIRAPNRYLNFDALNPTDVVRSIRVTITASTVNVVTDDGNVATRTFSQTVSIRNS